MHVALFTFSSAAADTGKDVATASVEMKWDLGWSGWFGGVFCGCSGSGYGGGF